MKKRIILFTSILVLVVNAICVGSTFSWFTITDNVTAEHFQTGKLAYTINGGFIGETDTVSLIVPGDELIKPDSSIYLTNQSTVKSCVKIVIDANAFDAIGDELTPISDILVYTFSPSWTKQPNIDEWIYTDDNGILPESAKAPTTIEAVLSIVLDKQVTQALAGKFLEIKISFYARQADNVDWSQIALIDYETQIVNP